MLIRRLHSISTRLALSACIDRSNTLPDTAILRSMLVHSANLRSHILRYNTLSLLTCYRSGYTGSQLGWAA